MQIKLRTLIGAQASLSEIAALELPASVAYDVAEALNLIDEKLQTFNKVRNDKITSYCTDENGVVSEELKVPKERIEEFSKEMEDLADKDMDLPFEKIKITDLGNVKISPICLTATKWLFEK